MIKLVTSLCYESSGVSLHIHLTVFSELNFTYQNPDVIAFVLRLP